MIRLKHRYFAAFAIIVLMVVGIVVYALFIGSAKESMSSDSRRQLSQLEKISDRRLFYRDSLKHVLDSTMLRLHKNLSFSDSLRYEINKEGLEKSLMFSFDYASQFASKVMIISDRIGDPNRIVESRAMASFYLSQACLFVEAFNMLHSVDADNDSITDQTRSIYYFCHAIYYQRIAVYVNDSINSNKYNRLGEEMFRKCIQYTDQPGIRCFAEGRIKERANDMKSAQLFYEKALKDIPQDSYVMQSLALSSLAKAFKHQGKHNQALPYYIKATELDIMQSQNSSIAIIDLTEHLYNHFGNIKEASKFLEMAIDNGEFYGMRSQITRVDRLIPQLSNIKEKQRINYFIGTIIVLTSLLLAVVLLMIRGRRIRRKFEQSETDKSNSNRINNLLADENRLLKERYTSLENSNKLKNEYIGRLLESNSELSSSVEEFAMKAQQKLKIGQNDHVKKLLDELELCVNKKEQLKHFDVMFLSLFPDFVDQFNALLKPEKQEQPSKEAMTPSMRIFALIRLGVKDNQQIARVLNYSYNTILNYRVRTRGNAINPETFETDVKCTGR